MRFSTRTWKLIPAGGLAIVVMMLANIANGQTTYSEDPSDVWLQAYLLLREGEEADAGGSDLQALSKYREAQKLFDYIARKHPNWKTSMMGYRRRDLLDKVHAVQLRLEKTNPGELDKLPKPDPSVAQELGPSATIRIPQGDTGGPQGGSNPQMAPQPQPQPQGAQSGNANPLQNLSQQFTEMNNRITFLTGANQILEKEMQTKDQSISTLQGELQKAREQEQNVKNQLAKAFDDLQKSKGMNDAEVKELERRLTLAAAELQKTNEKTLERIEALKVAQNEAEKLRQENVALQERSMGAQENSTQVVMRLKEAEDARDKARGERDEAKTDLADVTKERDDLKKMAEKGTKELMTGLTQTKEQLGAMGEANQKLTEERNDLAKKLEEELTKNGELSEQNKKLLTELTKAQKSMTAMNTKVADLEKERDLLKQDNADMQRERNMLIKQRNDLQKELDEYAILINANEQIDGDVKEMVAAKRKWQKEIDALRQEVEDLSKKEGDYKVQVADLQRQLKRIQDERQKLQEDNNLYVERVDELNGKLKTMLAELDNKNTALADANKQLDAVTKEREGLKKDLTSATGDLGAANKKMAEMDKQMADAEKQIVMLGHSEEENDLLRGIVRRQLVKQARLKESRDLVLAELQKLDMETSKVQNEIIQMADTNKLEFTEEELGMFRNGTEEDLKLIEAIENMELLIPAEMVTKASGNQPGGEDKKPSGTNAIAGHATVGARTTPAAAAGPKATSRSNGDITNLAKAANYDFTQGEFGAAKQGYEQVLKIDRHNVFALCNLGVIHIRLGDLRNATSQLERAIAHKSDCSPAHYYLGVVRYRQRDLNDALESFGECIKYREGHANAHNYIGLIASEKGWGTRAESEFKRAIDADPAHADAHFNLAVLYATRDTPAKELAERFYLKAIQNGAARDAAMEQYINS